MTNETIANVPRELLADLLGNDHDKRIMAERHLLAMLANAPSPAGVDRLGDMLSSLEVAPGACGCTDLCKERGLASDEVSKSCYAVYGGVTP